MTKLANDPEISDYDAANYLGVSVKTLAVYHRSGPQVFLGVFRWLFGFFYGFWGVKFFSAENYLVRFFSDFFGRAEKLFN